ncbi:MAG: Lrp/AsnC family transcriptional regulator, partial [Giesbergeria sp.]
DDIDRRILALLQDDADLSVSEVAALVGLSSTPCWKRIQKLKDDGVILKQVALCDPKKLGLNTTVFVKVSTNQHNEAWLQKFARAVQEFPEVVEAYRMSGDVDYLLRVVVHDIQGYDAVYKNLIKACELYDVSSSFAMEQIKYSTALPMDAHAQEQAALARLRASSENT